MALKIAIVGAGPSGLCLANVLHNHNIPCTVYERETSASARSQGGSLDLHPKTGQAALVAAGLYAEFEKHIRPGGEDFVLADKTGHRVFERQGDTHGRPEIDRVQLRQILLDGLPEGTIRWGSNLQKAETNKGKTTLYFADKTEENFDLVVGAEGAWSKIRPLVTTFKPFYSSISMFDMRIADINDRYPKLAELIGKGSYFAFGEEERQCMLCQRNGDGSVRIYAGGKKHEEWTREKGLESQTPEQLRASMLEEFSTWSEDLKELIRVCDDDIAARPLYMMPVGARWAHVTGATLIGDASHVMTPFSGEGVNIGLLDAKELGEAIIASPSDIAAATEIYEKKMFKYAEQVTQKTWTSLQDRFEPGGIQKFMDMINGMLKKMEEEKLKKELQDKAKLNE